MPYFSSTRNTLIAFRSGTHQLVDCRCFAGLAGLRDQGFWGVLSVQATDGGSAIHHPDAHTRRQGLGQLAAQAELDSGADQEYPALSRSYEGVEQACSLSHQGFQLETDTL